MMTSTKTYHRARVLRMFSPLLFVLLATAVAPAQTQTGTLTVEVTDQNQAAVADASVTVTELDTGRTRTEQTGANGVAVFGSLEAGRYRLTSVTAPNLFEPTLLESTEPAASVEGVRDNLEVEVFPSDASARLRIRLSRITDPIAKAVVESQVTAVAPAITAGAPNQVTSARQTELLDLPNLNTDITPLLISVPGAVTSGAVSSLGRVVIDGKGKEQQTFRLDGMDASPLVELPTGDPALGVVDSFQKQSVTALDQKQTSVVSGAFGPLNGPGTGSGTEAVTQQGGTRFRFQLYNLTRNDAFDARNFFDYEGKNAIRRNQFGAKVGGPLTDDGKAFFFVGFEGIRGRTERNVYEAVPADAACGGGATGPLAPFLAGFLPPGTVVVPGAPTDSDFVVARRRVQSRSESNALNFRLDWLPFYVEGASSEEQAKNKKSDDLFTFRFTRQGAEALIPDGVTGRRQKQRILFVNALAKAKLFGLGAIHDVRFGLNETRGLLDIEGLPTTALELARSLITVGGSLPVTGLPGAPETVPGAALGGLVRGPNGRGFDLTPTSVVGAYNLNRLFKDGAHELNAGGEMRFIRLRFNRLGGLTYAFPNVAALRAGTPSNVTFVSDLSEPGPFSTGTGRRRADQNYYMGYLQLTSKFWLGQPVVADKPAPLTLTYGLRYDYFGAVRERDNRAVVVDPETGAVLPQGAPFYRASKNNFEPRLGLAYVLPFSSGPFARTVLRAGAGVYLGVPRISELVQPIESDRFNTVAAGALFPADPAEIARNFTADSETRQFKPLAFARDFTTPERAYKWEASLTRAVGEFGDLRVAYVGNAGRNLPLATLANPIVSVQTNPDPTKPACVVRQFDTVRGGDPCGEVSQPFGEFFYRTSKGRSSFNALTVSLQRNTKHGTPDANLLRFATFKMQYTLSRNVGNVTGLPASNTFDFDADYGYNAADARHSFTLGATYALWEAFSDHVDDRGSLLWGWTFAPLLTVRSGSPINVLLDRPDVVYVDSSGGVFTMPAAGRTAVINTPGGGSSGSARVPDLLPGVSPYLNNDRELLNPAAFAIPAPGAFGDFRRGAIRGPSFFQLDLAVTRHLFDKRESNGVAIDLKVEFINILNRTNFGIPPASLPNALGASLAGDQIQPGVAFSRTAASRAFGVINAADTGRVMQFSINVKFNEGF